MAGIVVRRRMTRGERGRSPYVAARIRHRMRTTPMAEITPSARAGNRVSYFIYPFKDSCFVWPLWS